MAIGWEQIQLDYSTSKSSLFLGFMVCLYIFIKLSYNIISVNE
jgi:hypothetical protein